jgi:hypothetical protein
LNILRLCFGRTPLLCHDFGPTNIVSPHPGCFTLFFGLFSRGFSLLLFSFSGFHLLLFFDLSALQLLLQFLLTALKVRDVLFCDFCLNKCNLFLLPVS